MSLDFKICLSLKEVDSDPGSVVLFPAMGTLTLAPFLGLKHGQVLQYLLFPRHWPTYSFQVKLLRIKLQFTTHFYRWIYRQLFSFSFWLYYLSYQSYTRTVISNIDCMLGPLWDLSSRVGGGTAAQLPHLPALHPQGEAYLIGLGWGLGIRIFNDLGKSNVFPRLRTTELGSPKTSHFSHCELNPL